MAHSQNGFGLLPPSSTWRPAPHPLRSESLDKHLGGVMLFAGCPCVRPWT